MSLGNFLKNATAVVKGMLGDTSDKIAQDNPEYVLNEAILKAKDNIAETEEKVSNLITIQRNTSEEEKELKNKLGKIQTRIGMAQRDGAKEAVVEFPDLEGCFTQGKTLEEAKKMAEEILEEFLICLKEYKQEIPKATELKRELNENELIEWIYTKLK